MTLASRKTLQLLIILVGIASLSAGNAVASKRVTLVIGNSDYQNASSLPDTPNDTDSSLADIIPMFTKKWFRTEVLKHVTDPEVLKFWNGEFPNMNYRNSFDGVAPIANKLGTFLSHPNIRKALIFPTLWAG